MATADTTSPYTASWITTAVADGLYDLRVITTDKSGNTFTSALVTNVRVDNTLPTGAVTAPAAAANVRGTVAVTSSSADAGSGVASAQFQSSPARRRHVDEHRRRRHRDALHRELGHDHLRRRALRPARHHHRQRRQQLTSATIANVRVDNTAPTGSITAPAASANIRGTSAVTSNSADTAGRGSRNALFQRSPAGTNTWTNVAAADTDVAVHRELGHHRRDRRPLRPPGHHHRQVRATPFTSALVTNVRVDNTAPTVSVVVAGGATGAFQSGSQDLLQVERGRELRIGGHGDRRRLGRSIGLVPAHGDGRVDARGGDRHHSGRWALLVEQLRVDERCVDAGHLHGHGGRRRGEHRDERVHVHRGSDRRRPVRSPRRPRRRTCAVRSRSRRTRPTPARASARRSSRPHRQARERGRTSAPPTPLAPYSVSVGHDHLRRRALRPARRHHRQRRQHLHVGDHRQRPGRQHRAHRIDHRTRRQRVRRRRERRSVGELGRRRLRGQLRAVPDAHRTARARGRTSERPTRRRPTA